MVRPVTLYHYYAPLAPPLWVSSNVLAAIYRVWQKFCNILIGRIIWLCEFSLLLTQFFQFFQRSFQIINRRVRDFLFVIWMYIKCSFRIICKCLITICIGLKTMACLSSYNESGIRDTIRILSPTESFFHAWFGLHVEREINFLQNTAKMNSVWS